MQALYRRLSGTLPKGTHAPLAACGLSASAGMTINGGAKRASNALSKLQNLEKMFISLSVY